MVHRLYVGTEDENVRLYRGKNLIETKFLAPILYFVPEPFEEDEKEEFNPLYRLRYEDGVYWHLGQKKQGRKGWVAHLGFLEFIEDGWYETANGNKFGRRGWIKSKMETCYTYHYEQYEILSRKGEILETLSFEEFNRKGVIHL